MSIKINYFVNGIEYYRIVEIDESHLISECGKRVLYWHHFVVEHLPFHLCNHDMVRWGGLSISEPGRALSLPISAVPHFEIDNSHQPLSGHMQRRWAPLGMSEDSVMAIARAFYKHAYNALSAPGHWFLFLEYLAIDQPYVRKSFYQEMRAIFGKTLFPRCDSEVFRISENNGEVIHTLHPLTVLSDLISVGKRLP